jgi:hypothetical protein
VTVVAQTGVVWQEPQTIGGRYSYPVPKLVVDGSGTLHLFFHSFSGTATPERQAIYHSQLEAEAWQPVNDVLFIDDISDAMYLSDAEYYQPTDEIFVAGSTSKGAFVADAPAPKAGYASAWSLETLDLGAITSACMALSGDGIINLVYASSDGLYLTSRSMDENAWSPPLSIVQSDRDISTIGWCDAAIDKNGDLHLTWDEVFRSYDWAPRAIWYGRVANTSGSITSIEEVWPASREMRVSESTLEIGARGEVILIWNLGVGPNSGRYYRISQDHGETWTEPARFFDDVMGLAGPTKIVWDSTETWHALTTGDSPNGLMSMYSSTLRNGLWSAQTKLEHCEWLDAVVIRGNELHTVCGAVRDGFREVSYLRAALPAPALESTPQPHSDTQSSATPETAVSDPVSTPLVGESRQIRKSRSSERPDSTFSRTQPASQRSFLQPVLVSTVLAAMVIVAIVLIRSIGVRSSNKGH